MNKIANTLTAAGHYIALMLLRLRRYYYRRYAIYDCITINGMEVIHECRDAGFETKLRKYKLEIIPKEFVNQEASSNTGIMSSRLKPFLRTFHLVDKIIFTDREDSISIVHNPGLRVVSRRPVFIRSSSGNGALKKAIITIPEMREKNATQNDSHRTSIVSTHPINVGQEPRKTDDNSLQFDPAELKSKRESLFRTISIVDSHFSAKYADNQ